MRASPTLRTSASSPVAEIAPGYRDDQFMRLGWKVFLPISLVLLVVAVAAFMQFGRGLA